jgi:hypothetical protein
MQDNKKYFEENRLKFDVEKMPDGHENRFMKKINHRRRVSKMYLLSMAAGFLVLFVLYFVLVLQNNSSEKDFYSFDLCNSEMTNNVNDDILRADQYYSSKILSQQKIIFRSIPVYDFLSRMDFIEQIVVFNTSCCQLYEKLNDDPNNKRLQFALISGYQFVEQRQELVINVFNP